LQVNADTATIATKWSVSNCQSIGTQLAKFVTSAPASAGTVIDGGDDQLTELLADETASLSEVLATCSAVKPSHAVLSRLAKLHATIDERLLTDGVDAEKTR
jgi:hypothetical protein